MAYADDITNLGADHLWFRDNADLYTDIIGTANGTNSGTALVTTPLLCEDTDRSMEVNTRTADRVTLPTATTINNANQARKAVCGWFRVSDVELPHCRIYGEGNATTNFQFILFSGNSVMVEVRDTTTQVQVYSDIALAADRAYHLCAIFEGSGYADEVRFYIDGVEQTTGDPTSRAPGQANLALRGVGEFGDPAGTVGLNGVALVMPSPGDNVAANQIIEGYYAMWAAWGDEADAVLTDTEVRETLFERGALAVETIATGTESAMQTALDTAVANSTLSNETLSIEVAAVSGGGDFTLNLDDVIFDDLTSIHVRYNGTADTLTIVNQGTSNATATKLSAPFGGTIELRNEVTVKVTCKDATDLSNIQSARVLLEADTGGPLAAGTNILSGTTNASGVIEDTAFQWESTQPVVGKARKGSNPEYQEATISGTITDSGLDLTVLMVPDS